MSERTNAGEARTTANAPKRQKLGETTAAKQQYPTVVRLVYICLTCDVMITEFREEPDHPGKCPDCRNPPHLEGHE